VGKPQRPDKVKLLTGVLYNDRQLYCSARRSLEKMFGGIDYESPERKFIYTDYYEPEMGSDLLRRFLSFEALVQLEGICRVKVRTNGLEERLSMSGKRKINIDPGYMDLAKFVLFSTKDYAHRIYLGKGIYAENTLYYKDKAFRSWPWTYPDYRTDEYAAMLDSIRRLYKEGVRSS